MHGTIFHEMKKFVAENHGDETWTALCEKAGVAPDKYEPLKAYPDEEIVKLVSVASEMTGAPMSALLEGFGEFIVPDLVEMYYGAVAPEWKALEFIENAEETIHKLVRVDNPGAQPPRIKASRKSENEIEITYESPRKMCALLKGVVKGVATHYQQPLEIQESGCMLDGAAACTLSIKSV